jgi:hypothetical protein
MKLNLNLCFVTKGQPVNILWEQQYIDNLVAMQLPCIDHALSMHPLTMRYLAVRNFSHWPSLTKVTVIYCTIPVTLM